jgi:hypothetical protein
MYPLIKLSQVNNKYDVVITDHSYAFYTEDWNKIKIPKIMIIEDSANGPIDKQIKASLIVNLMYCFVDTDKNFLSIIKNTLISLLLLDGFHMRLMQMYLKIMDLIKNMMLL